MKSEKIRRELQKLLTNFEQELKSDSLRNKVLSLVPCFNHLRDLGKSLIPTTIARSARDRILHYFQKYPAVIISGDELLVVSGIQEYARRVRELKVQFGWSIVSGLTAKQMAEENEFPLPNIDVTAMGPSDYILLSSQQDRDAAHRWNLANEIRRENISVRDKILKYLRANVGQKVTGEELKYLAKDSGFHNEENMKMLAEKEIDAYVADKQFRQRDPLFKDRERYKERHRIRKKGSSPPLTFVVVVDK